MRESRETQDREEDESPIRSTHPTGSLVMLRVPISFSYKPSLCISGEIVMRAIVFMISSVMEPARKSDGPPPPPDAGGGAISFHIREGGGEEEFVSRASGVLGRSCFLCEGAMGEGEESGEAKEHPRERVKLFMELEREYWKEPWNFMKTIVRFHFLKAAEISGLTERSQTRRMNLIRSEYF
jgi:hypothetical protein